MLNDNIILSLINFIKELGKLKFPIYFVNAFTNKPFSGNPAAICIPKEILQDNIMQAIASEINLSETAFIYKKNNLFELRWFTPSTEVNLCGHATLAASHILWQLNYINKRKRIKYMTKSGILIASKKRYLIELNFPLYEVKAAKPPTKIINSLNIKPSFTGKTNGNYLFLLDDENEVKQISPNFEFIHKYCNYGIIVTSACSSKHFDYVCRYFAPHQGINEDPVTGSIQCSLGPFWQKILDKNILSCFQLSKRTGVPYIKVTNKSVLISGTALTTMKGYMYI